MGDALALRTLVDAGLVLRLFVNKFGEGFTEASGHGYAPIDLTGPWEIDGETATHGEQCFDFTGPLGDVFGYYYTQGAEVFKGERFADGPYVIINAGDQIRIAPAIACGE